MTTRSYFLLDDVPTAQRVVADLEKMDFDASDIHVIARDDVPLADLPEADLPHRSDVAQAAKRGVLAGGTLGLLAGTGLAFVTGPAGLALGGGALLGLTTAGGAAFGAWSASLVGVSVPNSDLDRFQAAIREEGKLLVLVDTENEEQAEGVAKLVARHSPATVVESGTVDMLV
jgi:hypothetical protein